MFYLNKTKRMNDSGHPESGAAAVEFALLITILLMLVAGVVEFGRTFWYYDALAKGARDGARFLSDSRASPTQALDSTLILQAQQIAANAATAAKVPGFSSADVDVLCDPTCAAPNYVTVSIDAYPVTIGGWIPFILPTGVTSWATTLSPYTTMRYMR